MALSEADLRPLDMRIDKAAAVMYQKCLRLPEEVPARRIAECAPPAPPKFTGPRPALVPNRAGPGPAP